MRNTYFSVLLGLHNGRNVWGSVGPPPSDLANGSQALIAVTSTTTDHQCYTNKYNNTGYHYPAAAFMFCLDEDLALGTYH